MLSLTFDGTFINVYINSILTASSQIFSSNPSSSNSLKTLNFIGKSNTVGDGYSSSYIDDLKFYSIALSQSQINAEFMQSGSYQSSSSSTKSFLSNYWPISDQLLCDVTNGNQMNLSSKVSFVPDRFG